MTRKEAIEQLEIIKVYDVDGKNKKKLESIDIAIKALSQQNVGHWILTKDYFNWICSECGGNPHRGTGFVPNKDGMRIQWKYCNLCGARMEVDE